MIFRLNDNDLKFPDPSYAEEDGLLAIGGDLTCPRLLKAYRLGIFPWYSQGSPILWYSPHQRFVLFPENLKISKNLNKLVRQNTFQASLNQAFDEVISNCASIARKGQKGTWINRDMQKAYIALHQRGLAHSVEIWDSNDQLVGGLYGIKLGNIFCGESMFSYKPNTSKLALVYLCKELPVHLIDCQVYTQHLDSLGAEMITQSEYLEILKQQII